MSLRLCMEWDEALHAEADAPDVRVHVSPLGAVGPEAHTSMLQMLQAHGGRYKAVVTFRPTGWTYTKAMRSGDGDGGDALAPRVWAENDGTTRMYGVPYSEHSSYTELQALVGALRPRRVVPTVNAET
eukprot:4982084-Prymnesium_polylepis.1